MIAIGGGMSEIGRYEGRRLARQDLAEQQAYQDRLDRQALIDRQNAEQTQYQRKQDEQTRLDRIAQRDLENKRYDTEQTWKRDIYRQEKTRQERLDAMNEDKVNQGKYNDEVNYHVSTITPESRAKMKGEGFDDYFAVLSDPSATADAIAQAREKYNASGKHKIVSESKDTKGNWVFVDANGQQRTVNKAWQEAYGKVRNNEAQSEAEFRRKQELKQMGIKGMDLDKKVGVLKNIGDEINRLDAKLH